MALSRRQARRQALMLLYQWDLSGQEIGSQYAGEIDPWARGVAESVAERATALDERITGASQGWTADRLGAVERSAPAARSATGTPARSSSCSGRTAASTSSS